MNLKGARDSYLSSSKITLGVKRHSEHLSSNFDPEVNIT